MIDSGAGGEKDHRKLDFYRFSGDRVENKQQFRSLPAYTKYYTKLEV